MKNHRLFVILILTLSSLAGASAAQTSCGTARWDVKTLTDAAAGSVDFTVRAATVEELTALPGPGPIKIHTPRYPAETATYRVSGRLVGFKLEADSDIHVVIAGTSGTTMIVEIPDPSCIGTVKHAEINQARADFIRAFGQPVGQFSRPAGAPQLGVVGVLFFDVIHGQVGVAPNGAELHPVLAVSAGQ
jgi:hypothetical protein